MTSGIYGEVKGANFLGATLQGETSQSSPCHHPRPPSSLCISWAPLEKVSTTCSTMKPLGFCKASSITQLFRLSEKSHAVACIPLTTGGAKCREANWLCGCSSGALIFWQLAGAGAACSSMEKLKRSFLALLWDASFSPFWKWPRTGRGWQTGGVPLGSTLQERHCLWQHFIMHNYSTSAISNWKENEGQRLLLIGITICRARRWLKQYCLYKIKKKLPQGVQQYCHSTWHSKQPYWDFVYFKGVTFILTFIKYNDPI